MGPAQSSPSSSPSKSHASKISPDTQCKVSKLSRSKTIQLSQKWSRRRIIPEPLLYKANPTMFKYFLQSVDRAELGELLRACERFEVQVDLSTLANANQSIYKQEQGVRETRRLAQRIFDRFLAPRAERFVVDVPASLSATVGKALRHGEVNRSTLVQIKFAVEEIMFTMLGQFSEWFTSNPRIEQLVAPPFIGPLRRRHLAHSLVL